MTIEEDQTNATHPEAGSSQGPHEEAAVAADGQGPQPVGEHVTDLITDLFAGSTELSEGDDPGGRIAARVGEEGVNVAAILNAETVDESG